MQATVTQLSVRRRRRIDGAAPALGALAPVADFEGFFRAELPAMAALAQTICGDAQLGEDLAQEALARAHERWDRIRTYDKPGAWLRRVTINLALSRRRRLKREVVGLTDRDAGVIAADDPGSDGEVWRAVALLPAKQRAAVALFYQEDLSTGEIAEILDCSVSSATTHLSRARKRLAEILGVPLETDDQQERIHGTR